MIDFVYGAAMGLALSLAAYLFASAIADAS
jgi:hypothetical protein